MNVVLVHPIHGAKIATHQAELEQDVQNGWMEYNPDTPAVVAPEAEKPKRKRKVIDQPIEQPNEVPDFLAPVSDESEGI